MAQHDYVIANGTGAAVRSDINNGLAAIVSNNSGTSEPATMYAYQWWADTTTGELKLRNSANNAWVTVGTLASANLGLLPSAGTLIAALGSASTPSVTFTGDLNTGIFSPSADQVAISTGGTERLFIDASGNVEIKAQGDLRFADSDSSNWVAFQAPATVASDVTWTLPAADGTSAQVLSTNGSGTLSWASVASDKISEGNTEAEVVDTGSDGHFKVTTEGTERLRVDPSGRLLVGTSTSRNDFFNNTTTVAGGIQLELSASDNLNRFFTFTSNNSDTSGPCLIFGKSRGTSANSKTVVQADDTIAQLSFQAADGSDMVPAAQISAAIDGTPGANDMPGRLVFSTTADGASSPTERMRITSGGNVLVGKTASNDLNTAGVEFFTSGATNGIGFFTASADLELILNRLSTDGEILRFAQDGTGEGSVSVSGNTVSYNQFLGSHWAALTDWGRPEIKIGTILETINELTDWKYAVIEVESEQKKICYNGTADSGSTVTVEYEGKEYEGIVELESDPEFNKAVKVKVNDTAASKAVYGVFVGWNNDSNGDGGVWNDMFVGAVGNYVIRMAADQEPEIGDLVESDGTGCAVVQDDDIIRTKTIAKITSTIPQVTYDDGSFLVTCVLYCG
jgi:hypothetical protein